MNAAPDPASQRMCESGCDSRSQPDATHSMLWLVYHSLATRNQGNQLDAPLHLDPHANQDVPPSCVNRETSLQVVQGSSAMKYVVGIVSLFFVATFNSTTPNVVSIGFSAENQLIDRHVTVVQPIGNIKIPNLALTNVQPNDTGVKPFAQALTGLKGMD